MTGSEREALTDEEGYALFRRAIQESDQAAWAAVYQRYRPMLVSWAIRNDAALQVNEDYGDVADQAFERAWRAMAPSRFGQFPNLATVLAYLRTCVAAVLIDSSRARVSRERAIQRLAPPVSYSPEDLVLSRTQCDELWQAVSAAAESQQDRVVLLENFAYGVPPRLIALKHPTLFGDVADVYAAQRNLKARLQRNAELRRLWKEMTTE